MVSMAWVAQVIYASVAHGMHLRKVMVNEYETKVEHEGRFRAVRVEADGRGEDTEIVAAWWLRGDRAVACDLDDDGLVSALLDAVIADQCAAAIDAAVDAAMDCEGRW